MTIAIKTDVDVGWGAKTGYAAGNYGKSLIWISLDYFLLFFLTDLWGLDAVQAGLVVTLALIWDGLCGPVVGFWIDRVKSPFGHYGPYLIFGAPLCAAAFWLVLREPGWRGDALVWYALGVGMIFRTAYTVCDVPHNALLARLSRSSGDAAALAGVRLMFSALGGLSVAFAAGIVFATTDAQVQAARISTFALWAGGLYVAVLWLSWLSTRRIDRPPPPVEQTSVGRLTGLGRSSMLWLLLLITFIQVSTVSVFGRSVAYFADHALNDEAWAGRALILITVAQGLSMPVWMALTQRLDKRQVLAFAYGALSLLLVAFLVSAQSIAWLRLPLVGLIGAFLGGCGFAIWAMLPDAIDHGQWRGGVRAEALSTALFLLMLKCASGVSALLLSLPLSMAGYDTLARGDPRIVGAIMTAMCLIPVAGTALCGLVLTRYDLGRRRHADLRRALVARDAGAAAPVG